MSGRGEGRGGRINTIFFPEYLVMAHFAFNRIMGHHATVHCIADYVAHASQR